MARSKKTTKAAAAKKAQRTKLAELQASARQEAEAVEMGVWEGARAVLGRGRVPWPEAERKAAARERAAAYAAGLGFGPDRGAGIRVAFERSFLHQVAQLLGEHTCKCKEHDHG